MQQGQNYYVSGPVKRVDGDDVFIFVLNALTGSATAGKGKPYMLTMKGAAVTIESASVVVGQYTPIAPATTATATVEICVPVADILTGEYGWVQTKGYVPYAKVTSVDANDQLIVANTATAFTAASTGATLGGAALGANTCAIALVVATSTTEASIYLLGRQVTI